MYRHRLAAFACLVMIAGPARHIAADNAVALPAYTITDLGAIPVAGADPSYASITRPSVGAAVNSQGHVAGTAYIPGEGALGFLYRAGGVDDLGTIGKRARPTTMAQAINDSDEVVGYSTTSRSNLAFLWRRGKIESLGTLKPDSDGYSSAFGISDRGQVVGEASAEGTGTYHAFLWEHGRMQDLGGPRPDLGSSARAINAHGQIVGFAAVDVTTGKDAQVRAHAYLWENGRGRELGPAGTGSSQANAINDRGDVVGRMSPDDEHPLPRFGDGGSPPAAAVYHAAVWRNGKMKDLGTLGGRLSAAHGINNRGDIVGSSLPETAPDPTGRTSPADHAFLYTGGRMLDLNRLIPRGSGWLLEEARGINDRGQIVGEGYVGTLHAFLLTPVRGR